MVPKQDGSPLRILLVDDEKNIRQTLSAVLSSWGHEVFVADSAEEAQKALRSERFDLLLTDFRMAGKSGIDLVQFANQLILPPVSVVMTAFSSVENAVNAIKAGAFDYLPKPFSNSQLDYLLKRIQSIVELKRENERLRSESYRSDYFSGQTSPAMERLEEFVSKVAPSEASVLLVGESGTGKSELAKLIHARSPRAARPFIVVNCTSLAESLIESELFGHVKGAFTGAIQDHVGKLELANRGTLLIDEIGDLSLNSQARLLRFLQEKVIERVGGAKSISVDARVIAATHRKLEEDVAAGKFREDLYFRLNIFECALVPLRYRPEDIPVLIHGILKVLSSKSGLNDLMQIPSHVMKALLDYSWPGNVRELRNTLERLTILSQGREASLDDLPESFRRPNRNLREGRTAHLQTLEQVERSQIELVLNQESNQERAAEILGITTVTLWRKRKQYGLK